MSSPQPQPQQINAADLDINQLAEIRRQLDEEITHLTNSFAQLKQAQAKFKACAECVADITPGEKDGPILVPLTSSLYVPGKLFNPDKVIVDVGTGYYVEKTRADARGYYASKVEFIRTNLESLQATIAKKQESMAILVGLLQSKLKEK